jgi:hypothetical protein
MLHLPPLCERHRRTSCVTRRLCQRQPQEPLVNTATTAASPALATRSCPKGPLPVDAAIYEELQATGAFDTMSLSEDEVRRAARACSAPWADLVTSAPRPPFCARWVAPRWDGSLDEGRRPHAPFARRCLLGSPSEGPCRGGAGRPGQLQGHTCKWHHFSLLC